MLAILRAWQKANHPQAAVKTRLSAKQLAVLNAIAGAFMMYHFNIQPKYREITL